MSQRDKPRLALNNITAGVRERQEANRTREAGHLDEIQGAVASMLKSFRKWGRWLHRLVRWHGYLLGSYRIATAPEPNSSRLTSFKSIRFDSPANNVGPWPASLGCTTNSYSSINPSSANASGSFTPATSSPLPDSRLSC